ncbi:MAG: gliding motility-associated C-terminal domain-containing protein [Vicingaceae bacterium]|nr:gliding motility-associated C-terminal domain-containing protein [Vicingaceae bacterium]
MRHFLSYQFLASIALILLLFVTTSLFSQIHNKETRNPFKTNVFIQNQGQFNKWMKPENNTVLFAINSGEKIFFTPSTLIFRLDKFEKKETEEKEKKYNLKYYYVHLEWLGSNKDVVVEKRDKVNGYFTYSENGFEHVRANGYENLVYKNMYKGVDVEYVIPSIDSNGIKYKITIHPDGNYRSLKMQYRGDIKEVNINNDGNVIIESMAGQMIDHFPNAYYKENGKSIAVKFVKDKRGYLYFDFPNGIEKNMTIIIDPWIVTPNSLTTDNRAYDVDFDDGGNVYISGGTFPYKLAKYDASGNFLWTFTLPNGFSNSAESYSEFGLIRQSGSVYIGEGFGVPSIIKINSNGNLMFNTPITTPNNEIWTIFYNPCTEKMLGFGGGTSGFENVYLFSDTNLTSVSVINSNGAGGICCNDITDAIIDLNGDFYAFSVSQSGTTPSIDNHIFKSLQSNSYLTPPAFDIPTNYTFDECGCFSSNFLNIGAANIMALNSNYLFSYDGKILNAWDKSTGASLGSSVVNSSYTGGRYRFHQGIVVDECNNKIYVGGNQAVHIYTFDGTNFTPIGNITTNIPDEVFDLALDQGRSLLHISGNNFLSTVPITSCDGLTLTKTVSCLTSSVTVTPSGGISPYTYLWSNGNTTNVVTLDSGTYTVIVQDASCIRRTAIDTVSLAELSTSKVIIPNVFSPNGDGQNDLFKVSASNISTISIEIFNRWGKLLYQSNTNDGWDGMTDSEGEISAGTYFYIIEVEEDNCGIKKTEKFKGSLSLLR